MTQLTFFFVSFQVRLHEASAIVNLGLSNISNTGLRLAIMPLCHGTGAPFNEHKQAPPSDIYM